MAADVSSTYDRNNRLASATVRDGDHLEIPYNAEGGVERWRARRCQRDEGTVYGYDLAGRVAWRTDLVNGQTFISQYTYLVNDALDEMTYPSGLASNPPTMRRAALGGQEQRRDFADTFSYKGTRVAWRGTTPHG